MPSPRGPAAAHGQAVLDMQGFAAPSGLRPVSPQPRSPQTGVSEDSARHRRRPSPGSSPEAEQTVQDTTELAEKVAEQVAKSLMPALKSHMEALRPKSEPRAMIPLEAVDRVSDGVAMALGNRLQTLEEQVAEVAALAPLLAGLRPLPTLDMKDSSGSMLFPHSGSGPLARRSLSALTEDDRPTTSRLRRVSKETSGKEPYLRRCFVVNFRRLMELQKVFAIIHELIKSTAIAALTLVLAGNVWQLGYSVLFVAILFVMYGFHAAHYDTMDISDYHHLVDLLEDDHGVCGGRSIDNPNRLLKALTLARTGRRRRAVLIILLFGLLCSGMWSMVAYSWTMELTEGVWSIGDEFYATLLLVGTLMLLFHTVFEWLYWRETQCVMPWWNRQLKEPWDPARHGIPRRFRWFGLPSMWFTCGSAYSDLSLWIQHAKGQWRGKKVNKVFPEEMALFSLHASGACQLRRTLQHAKLYSVQRCSFLTREGDANALPKGSDPEELQINFVFFDTQSKEYMQPEEEQKETQIHVLNRPIRSGTKGADRLDLGSTLLEHAANIEKRSSI